MIQQREVRRMENAVSESGNKRGEKQSPECRRQSDQQSRTRQQSDTETQHPMRAPPIDKKTRERLTGAGYDEKHRHESAHLRVTNRVLFYEPRIERRQHEVKEMRSAVREPDK